MHGIVIAVHPGETMKRRHFIKTALAGGVALGAGAGGLLWLRSQGKNIDVSIDTAIALLDDITGKSMHGIGTWAPYKVLIHCTQSVEFSMSEYPEHKSDLFKSTLGNAAFSVFTTSNEMRHGLSEPIPGAPDIINNGDVNAALTGLKRAYLNFQQFEGPLAAHFAYGQLTKVEYSTAHVIHLYNHLSELSWN